MELAGFPTPYMVAFGAVIITYFLFRLLRSTQHAPRPDYDKHFTQSAKQLRDELRNALPGSVVFPQDAEAYEDAMDSYWAQQECEVPPCCFVQPKNVKEVCVAVSVIKRAFDRRRESEARDADEEGIGGLFAVRSGGHFHVHQAASIRGGVLIDLKFLNKVTVSDDGTTVSFGAGVRWRQVFRAVEKRGLAVVGARAEDVGVGGFTLGSGYSYYAPQYGFAGSNIASYEVVLASGTVVTASATTNPDLWRALKGGVNNFGIVTQFTARTFPSANRIWSGFTFHLYSQAPKALSAFHSYVNRVTITGPDSLYDEHAAGPITSFGYVHAIGLSLVVTVLTHTKPPLDGSWPTSFASSFKPIWRLWSTHKLADHETASAQIINSNGNGKRQAQCTTTVTNDMATLSAALAAMQDCIPIIRKQNIKDMLFSVGFQPLLPSWANKGDPNMYGIDPALPPLVIVLLCATWTQPQHDEQANALMRSLHEQIEKIAEERGTAHRYRFANYAGGWQDVMASYGRENLKFMRGVSREVDPEGVFQRGCVGGFKLGVEYEAEKV